MFCFTVRTPPRSVCLSEELVGRAWPWPYRFHFGDSNAGCLGAMFKETAAERGVTTTLQEVPALRSLNAEACCLVTFTLEAYMPSKKIFSNSCNADINLVSQLGNRMGLSFTNKTQVRIVH